MGLFKTRIYVELDGSFYVYEDGLVEQLVDLSDVSEEGILVTDFPGSISRLMNVDTGPKFADIMARRKIEEQGEFDQAPHVIPHWRGKKGKNSTEILITALPYETYDQYLAHAHEASEPVIIYCLFGVLHKVLKRNSKRRPVAVVFQHGRTADLIIGSRRRVYFANRSMAFDETEEQIESLWDMVLSDIKTTEAENKIKVEEVLFISWINSILPRWRNDPGIKFKKLPEERVRFGDRQYKVSLFSAIGMLSPGASLSGAAEKWAFRSRVAIIPLNVVMVLAIFLAFLGYLYFSSKVKVLEKSYNNIERELSSITQIHYNPKSYLYYEEVASFLSRIYRARELPGYREIVNDLSDAFGDEAILEMLNSEYGESTVTSEVRGKLAGAFSVAHRAYRNALRILEKKGYKIVESSFSTSISESRFVLKLAKRIK